MVRLQQILKKWKKLEINASPKNTITSSSSSVSSNNGSGSSRSKKFWKKTLSFTDMSSNSSPSSSGERDVVLPKGYLAVMCVGKEEMKRFIIPTDYLGHQAFRVLLREAEEEFGFQQERVLNISCQVPLFQKILKLLEHKKKTDHHHHHHDHAFFFRHHHHLHLHLINNNAGADSSINDIMMINATCCSVPSDFDQLTPSHHPQMCR